MIDYLKNSIYIDDYVFIETKPPNMTLTCNIINHDTIDRSAICHIHTRYLSYSKGKPDKIVDLSPYLMQCWLKNSTIYIKDYLKTIRCNIDNSVVVKASLNKPCENIFTLKLVNLDTKNRIFPLDIYKIALIFS